MNWGEGGWLGAVGSCLRRNDEGEGTRAKVCPQKIHLSPFQGEAKRGVGAPRVH